jgi:hypothetical protein
VLEVLKPLWASIPETASRLRARIESVLDAARARGLIGQQEANPARWRGHLDELLPKRQKLTRGHHAAMPFAEVPQFLAQLRKRDAVAALALEFAILTAVWLVATASFIPPNLTSSASAKRRAIIRRPSAQG